MSIEAYFDDHRSIREWLARGAPLVGIDAFRHFGLGDKPRRQLNFEIANQSAFEKFLAGRTSGCLHAKRFQLHFDLFEASPAMLWFTDFDYRPGMAKRAAARGGVLSFAFEILRQMDQLGAVYACAYDQEEWWRRNLYKYDLWGDGRFSTAPVGKDIRRCVPGLYWLNYFSPDYARAHEVHITSVTDRLGGTAFSWPSGTLIELYDRAEDWPQHDRRVSDFLVAHPGFFAIDRIADPGRLAPRELTDFFGRLHEQWP